MPRRGENIYKRKDHRWEARYIRGRREDGSAIYGYCYARTYRDAKQKLKESQNQKQAQNDATRAYQPRCFAEYCEEWLQLSRTRVKESSYVKYSGVLEKHIIPRLGSYQPEEISSVMVEEFSYALLHEAGLSAKTVRDILGILQSVMRHARSQYPEQMARLQIVYPKKDHLTTRVLSQDEQETLTKYLLQDMDLYKFGVLLVLMTGLRLGELCALRWRDVSFDEKLINVRATMQRLKKQDSADGAKTKIVISEPKSITSARIVPMTGQAAALCGIYRCDDPEAFVLTGSATKFLEPRAMQYKLHKYITACNLDGVHFHTLRHTFATRCIEVDFEIKSLSEIMGHASPKITLERYVHSSLQLKRNNMNKLMIVGL